MKILRGTFFRTNKKLLQMIHSAQLCVHSRLQFIILTIRIDANNCLALSNQVGANMLFHSHPSNITLQSHFKHFIFVCIPGYVKDNYRPSIIHKFRMLQGYASLSSPPDPPVATTASNGR